MVLADEPVPVGCIVPSRLIGIMEAEQSKGDETERIQKAIDYVASLPADSNGLRGAASVRCGAAPRLCRGPPARKPPPRPS